MEESWKVSSCITERMPEMTNLAAIQVEPAQQASATKVIHLFFILAHLKVCFNFALCSFVVRLQI